MAKLTRESKIEIYNRWKTGESVSSLVKEYDIGTDKIKYLVRIIDQQGIDILRKYHNNFYLKESKQEILDKVLVTAQSVCSKSIEYGLSSFGLLFNWIKSYKDNKWKYEKERRYVIFMYPEYNYDNASIDNNFLKVQSFAFKYSNIAYLNQEFSEKFIVNL